MTFGENVTLYQQFLVGPYGYILRLDTAPNIRKIKSIQVLNLTTISDVVDQPVEINILMQMPLDPLASDIAYSLQSGTIYIFFNLSKYPYTSDTQFLLIADRYPMEITSLDSKLDIVQEDLELFITLSIVVAAELQGKLIPQRVLDKIEYLESTIKLER